MSFQKITHVICSRSGEEEVVAQLHRLIQEMDESRLFDCGGGGCDVQLRIICVPLAGSVEGMPLGGPVGVVVPTTLNEFIIPLCYCYSVEDDTTSASNPCVRIGLSADADDIYYFFSMKPGSYMNSIRVEWYKGYNKPDSDDDGDEEETYVDPYSFETNLLTFELMYRHYSVIRIIPVSDFV